MKKTLILLLLVLFFSCDSPSNLRKEFNCKNAGNFTNLELVTDYKKHFSVQFPKTWKTNLYYDNVVSSVFGADTTVNLTKTTLMDVSHIQSTVNFDAEFQQKIASDNTRMQLTAVKSKPITFLNLPSYLNLAKGKKRNYDYTILNVFTKIDDANFIHFKTEVYGNDLIDERFCKAIKLLEKIEIK